MTDNRDVYYIHVDPTTGEERSPGRYESRYMKVELKDDGYEYVTMNNAVTRGAFWSMVPIPPYGKGWEKFDTESDKWWVWRRKHVPRISHARRRKSCF